jgi:uncharacterized protein (TIGR03437 family)
LIYNRSVYNAASFIPAGVPSGTIAQGSIFSIFGTRLGPTSSVTASSFPLGNTLGVSINIIQGTTSIPAYPIYVSASQIDIIMPSTAPLGMASVQVLFNKLQSNMAPVQIGSSEAGTSPLPDRGSGRGALELYLAEKPTRQFADY